MNARIDAVVAAVDAEVAAGKEAQLRSALRALGPVLVAFSGGVDSSYLLAVAHAELGADAVAVTADSPSLARASLAEARDFCTERGIAHRVLLTDEFDDEGYRANDGRRCYACKAALFRAMDGLRRAAAQSADAPALLLGALAEDFGDHRPGLDAAREAGARWPLADVGLGKDEVRWLSRRMQLPSWNRPAEPCLSSRLPYGERVAPAELAMVEAAERALRAHGLAECRARHHRVGDGAGRLCRIEVPEADIPRVLACRGDVLRALRGIGYNFVSLDLAGLRSGGFNDLL